MVQDAKKIAMKNWLLAAIFVVTWNEYTLKTTQPCQRLCDGGDCWNWPLNCTDGDIYTVYTTTHTIKLATQKDVDLFIWAFPSANEKQDVWLKIGKEEHHLGSLIGDKAFNIKVREEK